MQTQKGFISWVLCAVLLTTTVTFGWLYRAEVQQHHASQASITTLQQANRSKDNQLANTKRDLENNERNLSVLQRDYYDQGQKLKQLEQARSQLQNQLAQEAKTPEQPSPNQVAAMNTLQQQHEQSLSTITSLQERLDAAAATDELYQNALAQLALNQTENQSYVQTIAQLQQQIDAAAATDELYQNAQAQLALSQTENQSYVQTIAQLQQQIDAATATDELYQNARAQLALSQTENQSHSQTIAQLQQQMKAENDAMQALEVSLQEQLSKLNLANEQLITQLENGTTAIKMPNSILFSSGSAQINKEGTVALQTLANALHAFPQHLVSVQGHSDQRPITQSTAQQYPSNWELSSARAAAAVRSLINAGVAAEKLQAVGLADTRPLVNTTDKSQQHLNRRIEIILLPNQFTLKELEAMQ